MMNTISKQAEINKMEKLQKQLLEEKNFKIINQDAGKGGQGQVIIVEGELQQQYAIKIISVFDGFDSFCMKKLQLAQNEANLLSKSNHPHIVKYYDGFRIKFNYFIQMEKCEKSLQDLVKDNQKVSKDLFIQYALQILSALRYLHKRGLLFRDISLKNILLDKEGNIKLCDFGLAKEIYIGTSQAFFTSKLKGTLFFLPPEILVILENSLNNNEYQHTFEGDVWAFGACLYVLAGASYQNIYSLSSGKEQYQQQSHLGEEINKQIEAILQRDPKSRPSLDEIFQNFIDLKNMNNSSLQKNQQSEQQLLQKENKNSSINNKQSINNFHPSNSSENLINSQIKSIHNNNKAQQKNILQDLNETDEIVSQYERSLQSSFDQEYFKDQNHNVDITISDESDDEDQDIQSSKLNLRINPDSEEAYSNLGSIYRKKKMFGKAMKCYKRALAINSNSYMINNYLGEIYCLKKIFDKSIQYYKKSLSINPHQEYAHDGLGNIFRSKKMYDQAILHYKKALQIKPNDEYAFNGLGNVYNDKKMFDQSISCFQKALSINQEDGYIHNGLGNAYYGKKIYEEAILCYKRALKINNQDKYAHHNLGEVYSTLLMFEKAISCYKKALKINPNEKSAHNGLGNVYLRQKLFDQALECYNATLKINQNDEFAYNGIGNVYCNKRMYDQAVSFYKKALQINPNYEQALNNLGDLYCQQKMFEESISCYEKALFINPNDEFAHNGLGNVYRNMQQFDQAIQSYRNALKLNPNDEYAHNGLGNVYYDGKFYDKAVYCYKKALLINKKDEHALTGLGNIYLQKTMTDKAIQLYQRALSINPNYEQAHNGLGNAYYIEKRFDEAIQSYNSAIQQNPNNQEVRIKLEEVLNEKVLYDDSVSKFKLAQKIKFDVQSSSTNFATNINNKIPNFDEAVQSFIRSLQQNANYEEAFNILGDAYMAKRMFGEASSCYKRALQINPNDPYAKKGLNGLSNIKTTSSQSFYRPQSPINYNQSMLSLQRCQTSYSNFPNSSTMHQHRFMSTFQKN